MGRKTRRADDVVPSMIYFAPVLSRAVDVVNTSEQ
jgi:hypothetical protein